MPARRVAAERIARKGKGPSAAQGKAVTKVKAPPVPNPLHVEKAAYPLEDAETNLRRAAWIMQADCPEAFPDTPEGFGAAIELVIATVLKSLRDGNRTLGLAP